MSKITLSNGATFTGTADECAKFLSAIGSSVQPTAEKKSKGKGKSEPKAELVEFTNKSGVTKLVTPSQAQAWNKWRDGSPERKANFEAMKATWTESVKAYKPSAELTKAIKADRASITHKVAKEKYGFVGTKKDLASLKDSLCK